MGFAGGTPKIDGWEASVLLAGRRGCTAIEGNFPELLVCVPTKDDGQTGTYNSGGAGGG